MDWLSVLKEVIEVFKTISGPVPVPTVPTTTAQVTLTKKPSAAVKQLQHILNQVGVANPPLAEDGWLGPKTEKAIMDGIAMAQPYLAFLGK